MGHKRPLTAEQELHIQRLICENRTEQLKLTFALWTSAAVPLLVQQELDLELPVRNMGEYLKLISTVTNQGKTRWMTVDDAFNSDTFIEFVKAPIKDADKKVFLILNNLPRHHSEQVKTRLAEHNEQIEPFYLPSYSPDLSPDERLIDDLKYALGSRVHTRTSSS